MKFDKSSVAASATSTVSPISAFGPVSMIDPNKLIGNMHLNLTQPECSSPNT